MEINIYIDGVAITPNPVTVKETFTISVSVVNKIKTITTADKRPIMTADGAYIERCSGAAYGLMSADKRYIKTADDNILKVRKED